MAPECARAAALRLTGAETDAELAEASKRSDVAFAIVDIDVANLSRTHAARRVFHHLKANNCAYPAILRLGYDAQTARAPNNGPLRKDLFILRMGMDGGSLSVDGLVDGFFVDAPFDVEFLRLMIRHHQGGFDMAAYAADHAEVQAVRDLALSMVRSQGAEVETMTRMLAARGGTPLPEP